MNEEEEELKASLDFDVNVMEYQAEIQRTSDVRQSYQARESQKQG